MSDTNRVSLAFVEETVFGETPGAFASNILNLPVNAANDETMTIGSVVYTFKIVLTGAANEIIIGSTVADTQINIRDAVNLQTECGRGPGQTYGVGTVANPDAHLDPPRFNAFAVIANDGGAAGNSIVTTETLLGAGNGFTSGTLLNGSDQAYQALRFTGEGLINSQDTVLSEEIRADRQNSFVARTSKSAEGPINTELSNTTYDDFIEAVLQTDNPWSALITDISASIIIAFDAATQGITATALTTNYVVGEWIEITGSANVENTGIFKIIAKDVNTLFVQGGNLLVDESAGASISITQLSSIKNGVLQKFYSIQKIFEDVVPFSGQLFKGMTIDTMELSVESESVITATFGFMGKKGEPLYGDAASSVTAATETPIMTATAEVLYLIQSCQTYCVDSFNISINNNGDKETCIGELSANRIRSGSFDLTGSMEIYFQDRDNPRRFDEFSDTSFTIVFEDEDGQISGVEVLRAKLTQSNLNAEAKNDSLFDSVEFTAFRDSTEGITLRWFRNY